MPELHHMRYKEAVHFNGHYFQCRGHTAAHRHIDVDGIPFSSIEQLVGTCPALLSHLNILAILVNFILGGEHFSVITDSKSFGKEYLQACQAAEENIDVPTALVLHPYGYFDVAVLKSPHISQGRFIFAVLNELNNLPYIASCNYPFIDKQLHASYQLLPNKN